MKAKDYLLGFISGVFVMWAFAAFIGFYQLSTIRNQPYRINRLTGKVQVWDGSDWQSPKPKSTR